MYHSMIKKINDFMKVFKIVSKKIVFFHYFKPFVSLST